MKRLIVLLITVVFVNSTIAQTTAINESFETWPAQDWNNYMYDEGGWVHSTLFAPNLGYGGGNCAKHKIANNAVDDWLVSPQIDVINSDYELVFYEKSTDLQYYTYAGIHISTQSGDPLDGDFVEIAACIQVEDQWTEHTVDLSAYNGETIYIAFVFQGSQNNWHHWDIDEVVVAPSTFIDGALTDIVNPAGINPVPSTENIIVTLHNYGTDVINDADFEWSINGVDQVTFEASSLNLNPGSESNITIGQYDFNTQGDYLIVVNLELAGDMNLSNNLIESVYFVTDPKDAAITDVNPEDYSPVAGIDDVTVMVMNLGDYTIDNLSIEWSVDGIDQTEFQASSLDLDPEEEVELIVGQYDFTNGLHEINATVIVSGDEDLSNNSNNSYVAINVLWESFEGDFFPPEMWTAENYPLKDYFWPKHETYYYAAQTDDNYFGVISDTLYTPLLQIESGDEITFWVNNSAFFTNNDKLIWKDGTTGETHVIESINSELDTWDEVTIDISAATGINYIGFVNDNPGSFGTSSIDLITSTASIYQFDHDLGVQDFQFEYLAGIDETHTFSVYIRNYGSNQVSGGSYSVKLMNESGDIIAEQSGITLQNWEEGIIEISHAFTEVDVLKVNAIIEYSSDQFEFNNTSATYSVYPVPADILLSDVGFPEAENLSIPFNTGGDTWTLGSSDVSQHLYYQDEIEAGYLYGVTLYYHELFGIGQYLPLQVWLKETELQDLSGGWMPFEETHMVFNDTIDVYPGYNSVYIPFDEPVLITGVNNIAIQYFQYEPEWPATACRFYATNDEGGPVRAIRLNDVYELDINDLPNYWGEHTDYTYTTFVYQPIGGEGVVSGTVYDENDEPIQWALVEVEGTGIIENTNADGEYTFPSLPYATYDVTASFLGYEDITETINLNQPVETIDFYLERIPQVSLYGTIYGSNAPEIPLEGVLVTIDGYDFLTTYTDENGEFLFENVYGNNDYTLSCQLYGYLDYNGNITLTDIDMDYGNIILGEDIISAYNVHAIGGPDLAIIEWQNPITSQQVKLQNDMDVSSFSLTNEPNENVWLGNKFDNDNLITITSVEILWDVYENAHDFVALDILDNQGNLLISSQLFQTYSDSLMTIDIPNISIEGDFFAMVHWQDNPESTDALTIDFTEGIMNTAYIMYPGEEPVLLSNFLGSGDGSFFVRVNTLAVNETRESRAPISYNIYKGLIENIPEAEQWFPLNTEPLTDLIYFDETWSNSDPQLFAYAVEAIYVEDNAEFTFSNFIAGVTGIIEPELGEINIYPNPASSVLNITGVKGTNITLYNIIGEIIYNEDIATRETTIDVSYLKNGNYFISVTGSQKRVVKKLVVAR